ncbi:kinase-like protein, partial [Jaminaea rosea]
MSSRQAGPPLHPPSSGPPGSLPPGTLVQVGPYTVSVKRYLSQGGFATVYLVNSDRPLPIPTLHGTSRNETLHVLKRIVVPDKEALADVRREVDVHKLLRSDAAVVHFLEASALCLPPPQTGYDVYILMEYCSGGGLLDLLNTRLRNRLSENEVLHIFLDVCKGLAAMHHLDPPVAHRDLKIENILIVAPTTPGGKPTYKLCDFGSAKPILSRRAPRSIEELKRLEADLNKSTTLPYRPPEMVDVYQRRVIDEKADIWAMGVLLYKLCYYTTPFEENGGGPLAILNVKYRFPSNPPYSDRIKGLIASLLVDPAARRPSIDQL